VRAAVALAAALAAGRTFGPDQLPEVADADDPLVDAARAVPRLIVDLKYAGTRNFTGRALYPRGMRCRLRQSAAVRLARAARTLWRQRKLRLVAWDCARPHRAQVELFRAHPEPGSVADPARGSLHERGVAIDLGLADASGRLVELPTEHDAFGPAAHADAPLPAGPAREHRDALREALHANGWRVNPQEWWHFSRLYGWRWPAAKME